MKTHIVKSWPHQFRNVALGLKTAELRKNDRDYEVGDRMVLREFEPISKVYTGRKVTVEITHKLDKDNVCAVSKLALSDEYAILSVTLTNKD